MIKILDKFTLTEKLVPLLSKIKTKEPSVMIATLAVHEEMGKKCEVEAGQFARFLCNFSETLNTNLGGLTQSRR